MRASELAKAQKPEALEIVSQVRQLRTFLQEPRARIQTLRETLASAGHRVLPMNYDDPGVAKEIDRACDVAGRCGHFCQMLEDAISQLAGEMALLLGVLERLEATDDP